MSISALSKESTPTLQGLRQWFATPPGSHVFATEQAMLDQLLAEFFGYQLLQLSVQNRPLFQTSQIQHKVCVGLDNTALEGLLASPANLPFADDSIDVVLLHHLLDYVESPQEVLREATRVTLPMGHLVIVGFNSASVWGVWRALTKFVKPSPWDGRFIRTGRLMDWLNLLNFKIDRAQYAIYGLPSGKSPIDDYSRGFSRNLNLPIGSVYVIVAKKQVSTLTPIRLAWKTGRSFGRLSVVRSVRHPMHSNGRPPWI